MPSPIQVPISPHVFIIMYRKVEFHSKFFHDLDIKIKLLFFRIYEMEVCFQVNARLLSLPPISPHPKHALSVNLSFKQLPPPGTSRQMVDFSGVLLKCYFFDLWTKKKFAIFSLTLSYFFAKCKARILIHLIVNIFKQRLIKLKNFLDFTFSHSQTAVCLFYYFEKWISWVIFNLTMYL